MTAGIVLLVIALAAAVLVEVVIQRRRARLATPRDYLRAGDTAYTRGDFDSAAEHYREAIRLDHQNPEAHYKLAGVAWERDDYDGAIEHLRECQRWAPEAAEADIEHALGWAHCRRGDHELALGHCRRAVELAPVDQEVRESLAALYHELGKPEEAKEVYPELEPPSAEERERMERLRRQLKGQGERALQRWDKTVETVTWVWRVARIGVAAWVLWRVLTWIYERVRGTGTAPEPSPPFVLVSGVAIAALLGAAFFLRAMEASRDRYVRRVMRGAGVSTGDIEAVVPREHGPPWWRVELSGLHLALWLGIPCVVAAFGRDSDPPGWLAAIAVYTIFAWIFKGGFWWGSLWVEPDRRVVWRERYRWFGTLKGTLFGLVAVPAIVFGFGVLMVVLAELFGLL